MKLENFVDLDLNFWNSMHLSLLTRSTKSKQFLSLQRLWFQKRHLEKTNKNFWQISVALATLWNVIVLFTVVYLHEVQLILGMHHDLLTIQNEIRRLPLNFPSLSSTSKKIQQEIKCKFDDFQMHLVFGLINQKIRVLYCGLKFLNLINDFH